MSGAMSLSFHVFDKQNIATRKNPLLTIGHLDFDFAVHQHDVLAGRGIVPCVIVMGIILAEAYGLDRHPVREKTDFASIGQWDEPAIDPEMVDSDPVGP